MNENTALRLAHAIANHQWPPLKAARLLFARIFRDPSYFWIFIGSGTCFGVIFTILNMIDAHQYWVRRGVQSFYISFVFAFAITYIGPLTWRVLLWPKRPAPLPAIVILNGLLSFLVGAASFLFAMLSSFLIFWDWEILMREFDGVWPQGIWGILFVGASIPSALGLEWDRWGRREKARQERLERMAEEACAVALRSQINPHFFFNALNTVAALIPENPEEAERAVELLAQALRPVLMREQPLLGTLDREIEVARAYGEIESLRHGNRIIFDLELPDDARGVLVPSLCLQPLVENAVRHGASDVGGEYHIALEFAREENMNIVTLWSSPEGDPRCAGSLEPVEEKQGHALENIRLRLRALFGSQATLNVRAAEDHCSVATMSVPDTPLPAVHYHAATHAFLEDRR